MTVALSTLGTMGLLFPSSDRMREVLGECPQHSIVYLTTTAFGLARLRVLRDLVRAL